MPDVQERDKAQIGLTPAAAEQLDRLMELGWFSERQDAYRVAIGVALARQIVATPQDLSGVTTSYNFAGGVDRDGKLRNLISLLAPSEASRPGAYAERLAHAGIAFLVDQLVQGGSTLTEALSPPANPCPGGEQGADESSDARAS
jgi:hypothetical protein